MTTPPFTVEIYKGRKRLRQAWRWRATAANGNILADSGEAYTNQEDALAAVYLLFGEKVVINE